MKCLGEKHTCPLALKNKQASAKWIATTYIEKFCNAPKWDVSDMKRELQLTYGIRINDNKCYRARNEARILLEGTLEEEYKKLRSYVAALQNADPEGQFILEVDVRAEDKVTFKRIVELELCSKKWTLTQTSSTSHSNWEHNLQILSLEAHDEKMVVSPELLEIFWGAVGQQLAV
ncbi:hypothetical protein LINPERPRIM_LOCUS6298 [Linum perenne]